MMFCFCWAEQLSRSRGENVSCPCMEKPIVGLAYQLNPSWPVDHTPVKQDRVRGEFAEDWDGKLPEISNLRWYFSATRIPIGPSQLRRRCWPRSRATAPLSGNVEQARADNLNQVFMFWNLPFWFKHCLYSVNNAIYERFSYRWDY